MRHEGALLNLPKKPTNCAEATIGDFPIKSWPTVTSVHAEVLLGQTSDYECP